MRISDIGTIELHGMRFRAYHGCLPEERERGNWFTVRFKGDYRLRAAAESDELEQALDYRGVYEIVAHEMKRPSSLLEHVAGRIADALAEQYPQLIRFELSIAKAAPMPGVACSVVTVRGGAEAR